MIVVDAIQTGPTPWPGGRFSHLLSDTSADELLEFARSIGLHLAWYQHASPSMVPHFDISPAYRRKAIAAGATEVTRHELVAALWRYRERNPVPCPSPPER